MRAHHETGGADAGEIHVAAEIVGARPQRRERRLQPRLQFDKAADRGRSALAHRQPHALQCCRRRAGSPSWSTRSTKRSVRSRMSRVSTKPDSDTEYIGRASTPCATRAVFQVATAKPAATAAIITATGNSFCRRSRNAAAQSTIAAAAATEQNRLTVGGKIAGDPGAEGDRHPGQQAAGAGFGGDPRPQFRRRGTAMQRDPTARGRRPAPPRAAARCRQIPASGRSPAPLCHRVLHPAIPWRSSGYRKLLPDG